MVAGNIQTGGLALLQPSYLTGGAGNARQIFASGGATPGATAADNVMAAFTLPAFTFDTTSSRGIKITAAGVFAANGATKTAVKLIYNPLTAVVGSTVGAGGNTLAAIPSNVANAMPWFLEAMVLDTVGSGNQTAFGLTSWYGLAGAWTVVAPVATVFPTADESQPINIAITGNAATTVTDIQLLYFTVAAL